MSRKRKARANDDEPGDTLPALANPATGETSKDVWHRWSIERTARDRKERLREKAMAEAESERAIYPVEIARHVAQHAAQGACPEWRYLKDLIQQEYGRILREQPEMRQKDVRAREQIIVALFNALPAHLHGALGELRTIIELVSTARESTTFLLGFEIGREAGRQQAFRDPRVMLAPEPTRRALPQAAGDSTNEELRLHLSDGQTTGGAR